jgi:hypothetical protein
MLDLPLPKPDNAYELGRVVSFSTCRNERLDLSGVRQPAELRRTALPETGDPPVPSRTAESPYSSGWGWRCYVWAAACCCG